MSATEFRIQNGILTGSDEEAAMVNTMAQPLFRIRWRTSVNAQKICILYFNIWVPVTILLLWNNVQKIFMSLFTTFSTIYYYYINFHKYIVSLFICARRCCRRVLSINNRALPRPQKGTCMGTWDWVWTWWIWGCAWWILFWEVEFRRQDYLGSCIYKRRCFEQAKKYLLKQCMESTATKYTRTNSYNLSATAEAFASSGNVRCLVPKPSLHKATDSCGEGNVLADDKTRQ